MYEYTENGNNIKWEPNNSDLAAEAMKTAGVLPDTAELPSDAPITVNDGDKREQVRKKYRELHIKKYGKESKYYEGTANTE